VVNQKTEEMSNPLVKVVDYLGIVS